MKLVRIGGSIRVVDLVLVISLALVRLVLVIVSGFQSSEEEVYSVSELLGDVANCKSASVHLIVDQSFAGA